MRFLFFAGGFIAEFIFAQTWLKASAWIHPLKTVCAVLGCLKEKEFPHQDTSFILTEQFCRQGEGPRRETVDIFMSLFFGFFKHINAFYLVKNILGNYRIRLNTVIHLHYCEHKIYCDDQGLIWYMYLNNSFHFFWKYVWVKKYMEMRVILFKNWKHVFKMMYQTAPLSPKHLIYWKCLLVRLTK